MDETPNDLLGTNTSYDRTEPWQKDCDEETFWKNDSHHFK